MIINEISDKKLWEEFISTYSASSLFQSWNWGEAIKKIQNPKSKTPIVWRLGFYDKDQLVGVAQIHKVLARRGIYLHIRHGPIFSLWTDKYFDFALAEIKALAARQHAGFIRISPKIKKNILAASFFTKYKFNDSPIHQLDGEVCWVINLNQSNDELLSNMRKSTRYLIKTASKFNIVIKKSRNSKDISEFFKLYQLTAKRHHFIEHQGIREEFECFLKDDQALLFKGYYNRQLYSAALIIFYNHQAIYHHSASIESKYPVNYLLQWEVIQEAKRRGKSIYNLWGVTIDENNKRHPWRGLSHFKKGFGGNLEEYIHAKDYPLTFLYCATYCWELIRKIWKGY